MTKKSIAKIVIFNFFLMVCVLSLSTIAVFSWFSGQGYSGKTMTYNKNLHIGAVDSNVKNFYGESDSSGNLIYYEIDPNTGFGNDNLVPGSYIYLRTDITNNSYTHQSMISLFLQNIQYDYFLSPYLFFGKNEPEVSRMSYSDIAKFNQAENKYTIESLPLLTNFTINRYTTVSVYWYVYIDTSAEIEISNCFLSLGNVVLTHN